MYLHAPERAGSWRRSMMRRRGEGRRRRRKQIKLEGDQNKGIKNFYLQWIGIRPAPLCSVECIVIAEISRFYFIVMISSGAVKAVPLWPCTDDVTVGNDNKVPERDSWIRHLKYSAAFVRALIPTSLRRRSFWAHLRCLLIYLSISPLAP